MMLPPSQSAVATGVPEYDVGVARDASTPMLMVGHTHSH